MTSTSKFTTFVKVGIVVTLLLIGVVILLLNFLPSLQNFVNKQTEPAKPEFEIPRSKDVSTDFTQDTAKWVGYNGGQGFSFSYPPEWKGLASTPGKVFLSTPDLAQPPLGTPITILRYTGKTYDEIKTGIRASYTDVTEKPAQFGVFQGVELNGKISMVGVGMVQTKFYLLQYNDVVMLTEYNQFPGARDYSQVYDQIVNTLAPAEEVPVSPAP